jgi:hypothetical protein
LTQHTDHDPEFDSTRRNTNHDSEIDSTRHNTAYDSGIDSAHHNTDHDSGIDSARHNTDHDLVFSFREAGQCVRVHLTGLKVHKNENFFGFDFEF